MYTTYDLKVGYSCNNKCKHCVIDGNKKYLIGKNEKIDLSTDEIFRLIDENCDKGINRIVLTGGEISIRKDFGKIIEKCKTKNVDISIQTNGRAFSKIEVLRVLYGIKNLEMAVALHSYNADIHDKITGVKGSFFETCQGIKNLSRSKIRVCVKVVISKYNEENLSDIVVLAKQLGAKSMNIAFPHALGAAKTNFYDVVPRYQDLSSELNKVCEVADNLGLWVDFETIPCCIIPKHVDRVSEMIYNTEQTMCSPVKENIFQWDEKRKIIKAKGNNCVRCKYDKPCEGVWAEYVEAFGADELCAVL